MKIKPTTIRRWKWRAADFAEWLVFQFTLFVIAAFVVGYVTFWLIVCVGIPIMIFMALLKYVFH